MRTVELGHVAVGEGPTVVAVHGGARAHVVAFSSGALVALTALQLERRLFASLTVVAAPAVTLADDREAYTDAKAGFVRTVLGS